MADRGIDAGAIGTVLGLASLVRLLAVPLWGAAADRVGRRRPMLLLAATGSAAAVACFPLAHAILPLLLLVTLQGVAAAALTPLADTLTLALAAAGRLTYGRTRAWGSAAYMLATAAAGPVLGWAGSWIVPGPGRGWLRPGRFTRPHPAGTGAGRASVAEHVRPAAPARPCASRSWPVR